MPEIGRALRRVEDERLITGSGAYIADISRPGQVWARVVRSQVAHGELRAVHLDDVRSRPDVVAAFCAADIPEIAAIRIPLRMHIPPGTTLNPEPALQPILASDRVRYVGEPIAVVVATDAYAAEDAAEEVWAEIDELEPVLEPIEAVESQTLLYPDLGTNLLGTIEFKGGASVDALFASADVVVRKHLSSHRHGATPMETRGLLAYVDDDGRLTVYGPTKVKHFNRQLLSELLSLPVERVRFIEPDVGGGFGARGEFYPEDALIPWLAMKLGRPVKWIEDRAESLVAMNQSREQTYEIEMAATADGRLLAFRSRNWCNMGAYFRTNGVIPPLLGAMNVAGPYHWEGYESTAEVVVSNKTPLATMRGPGEVESAYVRERMIDLLAERLELDPAEVRMKNLIAQDDLPYRLDVGGSIGSIVYASGNYRQQFQELLDYVEYEKLRAEQGHAAPNELLGIGMGCGHNAGGSIGPFEWARVIAAPDGTFTGYVGVASVGQGVRTALGQILADELGVSFDRVRIEHSDTDTVLEGEGAYADRGTIFGAGSLHLAVEELVAQARKAAADALEVSEDDLEVDGDLVRIRGTARAISFGELECQGTARFELDDFDFDFCACVAVVSVDRRTGQVTIKRFAGAYDVGHVINPMIVEGQLDGAAAQGISGALFEESAYDEHGQPIAASFMDYLLPTRAELPDVEALVFEFPSPTNPLGVKGAGNPGIINTHAAVANAVANALGSAGQFVTDLPLRPGRVWELLQRGAVDGSADATQSVADQPNLVAEDGER